MHAVNQNDYVPINSATSYFTAASRTKVARAGRFRIAADCTNSVLALKYLLGSTTERVNAVLLDIFAWFSVC